MYIRFQVLHRIEQGMKITTPLYFLKTTLIRWHLTWEEISNIITGRYDNNKIGSIEIEVTLDESHNYINEVF